MVETLGSIHKSAAPETQRTNSVLAYVDSYHFLERLGIFADGLGVWLPVFGAVEIVAVYHEVKKSDVIVGVSEVAFLNIHHLDRELVVLGDNTKNRCRQRQGRCQCGPVLPLECHVRERRLHGRVC